MFSVCFQVRDSYVGRGVIVLGQKVQEVLL